MDTVISFIDRAMERKAVFKELYLNIGKNRQQGLIMINKYRVWEAEKVAEAIRKERRIKSKQKRKTGKHKKETMTIVQNSSKGS